jgi:hypothetical protein
MPWALLVAGSVASLAANVAVAEPTLIGRVIAAWPSFALTASYEFLTRRVRRSAVGDVRQDGHPCEPRQAEDSASDLRTSARGLTLVQAGPRSAKSGRAAAGRDLQRQAWQWALANRTVDGVLPTGTEIARQYGRHERWGRLVKCSGMAGEFATVDNPALAGGV